MPRGSNNFRENVLKQETRLVALQLLTLEMDVKNDEGVVETVVSHYVNDYVPVDSLYKGQPVVFQPASFKLNLGPDISDSIPRTKLDFDAGDRQFIRNIRASEGTPRVILQVVMSNTPDIIEIGPVEFQVEAFALKSTAVSADLTVEPVLNEPLPARKYTPTLFPMLWRGEFES